MDAIDTTPVTNPVYSQISTDRPRTPDPVRTFLVQDPTAIRGYEARTIASTDVITSTVAELGRTSQKPAPILRGHKVALSPAEKAQNDRVALLAQKYEGNFNREDGARLEILTQRIRRLNPRITPSGVKNLSRMVDQIEEISDGIEELRSQFNF